MRSLLAAGLLSCVATASFGASASISAFVGGYLPTSSLFAEASSEGFVGIKQQSSLAMGGHLTIWTKPRVAFDLQAAVSPSKVAYSVDVQNAAPSELEADSEVTHASVSLLYAFYKPPLEPVAMYLLLGVGATQRGGPFYDTAAFKEDSPDFGFTGGLGARYGVDRGLYLRIEARDYVHTFSIASRFEEKKQHDLLIGGGIEWVFLR